MLKFYVAFSQRLEKYLWFLWLVALSAAAAFAACLFRSESPGDGTCLLVSTCVFLWSFSLIVFIPFFRTPFPAVNPSERFLVRLKTRARRMGGYIMAIVMTVLLCAVVFFSLRAVATLVM